MSDRRRLLSAEPQTRRHKPRLTRWWSRAWQNIETRAGSAPSRLVMIMATMAVHQGCLATLSGRGFQRSTTHYDVRVSRARVPKGSPLRPPVRSRCRRSVVVAQLCQGIGFLICAETWPLPPRSSMHSDSSSVALSSLMTDTGREGGEAPSHGARSAPEKRCAVGRSPSAHKALEGEGEANSLTHQNRRVMRKFGWRRSLPKNDESEAVSGTETHFAYRFCGAEGI